EGEEAFEGIGAAFVADGQASVTGQPGDAAFDDPAVAAQFLAGLDADASQAGHNSPSLQPDSAFGTVVCLVAVQLAGLAAARSAAGPDRGDGAHQGLDSEPVRGGGRGNAGGQGQSAPVGEHMQLRARLASVDRIRSGHSAPLFRPHRGGIHHGPGPVDQPLTAQVGGHPPRWIRAHNPASVHRRNHRCAVGTFTPNDCGNHRQAHPLVSTYTIAVNTLRASAGARPPLCGRSPACGISGSTSSQSSSGTNRCDNASTTHDDLALNTDQDPNETRSKAEAELDEARDRVKAAAKTMRDLMVRLRKNLVDTLRGYFDADTAQHLANRLNDPGDPFDQDRLAE